MLITATAKQSAGRGTVISRLLDRIKMGMVTQWVGDGWYVLFKYREQGVCAVQSELFGRCGAVLAGDLQTFSFCASIRVVCEAIWLVLVSTRLAYKLVTGGRISFATGQYSRRDFKATVDMKWGERQT